LTEKTIFSVILRGLVGMWSFAGKHNKVSSANLGSGEETHIPELLWKPEAMQVWLRMNKNTTQLASN